MIYTTDTWRRALWSTIDTPNLGPCRRAYGNRLFFFWQMWILRISSASSDPLTQINDTHFKIIFHTLSIFWNICHFRTGATNKTPHFYCYYIDAPISILHFRLGWVQFTSCFNLFCPTSNIRTIALTNSLFPSTCFYFSDFSTLPLNWATMRVRYPLP